MIEEIAQYNWRAGAMYASPAHVVSAVKGSYGVPYWMHSIPMQTCNLSSHKAPTQPGGMQLLPVVNYYGSGQYAFGRAPTKGIYTGVSE